MAVNQPTAGKQPPPLVKKLISSVVGAPANKPGQQGKQPLKGMDSLVTLLPTKEAEPAIPPAAEPEQRQPIRSVGECEATYQSMVDLDLLNRSVDMDASREVAKTLLEAEPPAPAEESAELAELQRRDDEITAETHARIYGGTEALNISPDTTAKELELLESILQHPTTHHVYSSKHHIKENETDMTQQEQVQEQTQEQTQQPERIGPFLNTNSHAAASEYFTEEVLAKLDNALKNYGPMSPHGSAENYGQFKQDLVTKNLEGRVSTYLARYCSNIAFMDLAEKIDESILYRTAIADGIHAIDLGRGLNHYGSSSEVASANSVRCAWDVVDAVAYASAVANAANRWIFSADPSGFTELDISELLLSKGVHTVITERLHSPSYMDNTMSYNRSRLKEMKSIEHATNLMMELFTITEKLMDETEVLNKDHEFGSRGGLSAISDLQNAVSLGISLLSDAISFMTTSYPRYNGGGNGHYWLTNPNANIHMCTTVDENYLVTVELNIYIREQLKATISEQEAVFDEALTAYLPGDVAINTSIMANLKKVMMEAYISGRQSAIAVPPKPIFGFDPGYRQLMGVYPDQPAPTQKDPAGVSAMRDGLKRLREGAFNPGEDALNQGGANIQLQGAIN